MDKLSSMKENSHKAAQLTNILAMDMVLGTPADFRKTAEVEFARAREVARLIKE